MSAVAQSDACAPVSARRRRSDAIARGVVLAFTLVAIVPLVLDPLLAGQGRPRRLEQAFFTTDPTGRFLGDPGGIRSAILGTIEMVALASIIAVPPASASRSTSSSTARRRASRTSSGTSSTS